MFSHRGFDDNVDDVGMHFYDSLDLSLGAGRCGPSRCWRRDVPTVPTGTWPILCTESLVADGMLGWHLGLNMVYIYNSS